MNLSWANQFAKTALKTAQQKIDSVLDIRPDEEAEASVVVEVCHTFILFVFFFLNFRSSSESCR